MTTAEAIEGITDAGQFEILATRVLRLTDDDCKLLEHMGVNAAGKTIANPIDSFCQVPGTSPPRFVMAAFTTDKLESLERKWLFDHAKAPRAKKATDAGDGDLVKAARRAQSIRSMVPDATFVVHLCTNKQPDETLMAAAASRGNALGLEVRFLARSRLRDVLDVTPDGQWLRKEHLGIQADRLSFPLFQELSAKSLERYGREFLITPPEAFIATKSERALVTAISGRRPVHVVTGASGTGKSVACYQALRRHLALGSIGLWIPGEIAAQSASLDEAISVTLRSLHPTIAPTAGAEAIALASILHQLVLVIDDVNRGGRPADTLRKLLTWQSPSAINNADTASHSVVIPAWDVFWAPLESQFRSAGWLTRTAIDTMGVDEACACLVAALGPRAEQFAVADQINIVDALGRDPILIALYAASIRDDHGLTQPTLAAEVVEGFVQSAQAEAAASSARLQADYNSALLTLARSMLVSRDLYPRWDDVQGALTETEVAAVRDLARLGKLCRVTGRAGENRFEFRHDRILEHFLACVVRRMFTDLSGSEAILSDPFYASFVGRALAIANPAEELIDWIERHTPLALVASIRFLPRQPDDRSSAVVSAASRWLASVANERSTPQVIFFEAKRILEGTDSPLVLRITEPMSKHRLVGRARLANGSAAAITVGFGDPRWFAPAINDRELDAVLSRAIHRHKASLVDECSRLLREVGTLETEKLGALVLAGFIGDPSLAGAIQAAWNSLLDSNAHWFHVIGYIWSVLFNPSVDKALEKLAQATPTDYSGSLSNDHFILAHLLRDIPIANAEPLLLRYWGHLQFSPLFVQAALYLGSPECVARAEDAVAGYPDGSDRLCCDPLDPRLMIIRL